MTSISFRRWLMMGAAAAACLPVLAVSTQVWDCAGLSFEKGEFEGTLLTADGHIRPAPQFEEVLATDSAMVLTLEASSDGRFVFYGEGMTGKVYGYDVRKNKVEIWLASQSVYVRDLLWHEGALYATVAPGGSVYRIPPSGDAKLFWKAPAPEGQEVYVWALCPAGKGALYVGSGAPAKVHRVDSSGKETLVFESSDAYITSLAGRSNGAFLGTYNQGLVVRLDEKGGAYALYDSELAQITALAPSPDGTLYAAAVTVEEVPPPSSSQSGGRSSGADETVVSSRPQFSQKLQSQVYRIHPSGYVELYAEFPDLTIYDMTLARDGGVLVSTGNPARLYKITAPKEAAMLAEFEANQASAMVYAGDVLYVATSNPGKLYRQSADRSKPARYQSEIYDMKGLVQWGELSWIAEPPAGENPLFYARSGNVAIPDRTWSGWQGPLRHAEGENIACPAGRYVQWKAEWPKADSGKAAGIRQVQVRAMPFNTPPEVLSIEVYEPGVVFSVNPPSADPVEKYLSGDETVLAPSGDTGVKQSSLGRRMFKRGMRTFQWFARDLDGDALEYRLYYRSAGAAGWVHLNDVPVKETVFTWNTRRVADGRYEFKVEASDAPSNYVGRAHEAQRVSGIFEVDNTPPAVLAGKVSSGKLRFRVEDAASVLVEVQVSFRNDEWQALAPMDGVLDGRREEFEVEVPGTGVTEIGIKAIDRSHNVGTAYVPIKSAS